MLSINNKSTRTHKILTSLALFIFSLALIFVIAACVHFGYQYYLYSGCTLEISEEFSDPEQNLIEDISFEAYKTTETYRINSVKQDVESSPEVIFHHEISTNILDEPFLFDIYFSHNDGTVTSSNTTFVEFSKRDKNIIDSARKLVINYIKTSDILKNKEHLIQEIESVPFFLYTKTTVPDLNQELVTATHLKSGIYCSKRYQDAFCEEAFVHELLHHLSYVSNGYQGNRYRGLLFDEVMTQIITKQIHAKVDYGTLEVDYDYYFTDAYKYLSIFGKDAIEAYFYGFDDFFTKYGGDTFQREHDAFMGIFCNYDSFIFTYGLTEAFLGTWYARLYE